MQKRADRRDHARIAHHLGTAQHRKHRDHRRHHLLHSRGQHLAHHAWRSTLNGTAGKRRQENPDARRVDPRKRKRTGILTAIHLHVARKRRERGMYSGHQVRRAQQQHKDQDEARPGRKRRLNGELLPPPRYSCESVRPDAPTSRHAWQAQLSARAKRWILRPRPARGPQTWQRPEPRRQTTRRRATPRRQHRADARPHSRHCLVIGNTARNQHNK